MAEEQKPTPKIYTMPEQFLVMTRSAGMPVSKAPPPPLQQPQAASPKPQAPPPTAPVASATAPAPVPVSTVPAGPGIPLEEGGKRKMLLVWGSIGGVIIVVGGLAAFFVLRSVPSAPTPTPPAPATVNVVPAPVPPPPVNVAPPEPEPEPEPELVPAADQDTDRDGLTDAEELLLGTDINLADSDGDGYSDSVELSNLYNPVGIAPQRLLDAGLVYEYEHPTHGWAIYLPRQWPIAATDQEQQEVIITTQASGESFVLTNHGAEVGASLCRGLQDLQTKRGANGCRNPSEPIAYVGVQQGNTLSIEHRTVTPPARYPHIFDMILQSFTAPSRGGPIE